MAKTKAEQFEYLVKTLVEALQTANNAQKISDILAWATETEIEAAKAYLPPALKLVLEMYQLSEKKATGI